MEVSGQHHREILPIQRFPAACPHQRNSARPTFVPHFIWPLMLILATTGLVSGLARPTPPSAREAERVHGPQTGRQLPDQSPHKRPITNAPLALVVRREHCRVALPTRPAERGSERTDTSAGYALLLGSLGTSHNTFQVTLSLEAAGHSGPQDASATIRPLPSLPIGDPSRLPLDEVPPPGSGVSSWLHTKRVRDVGFHRPPRQGPSQDQLTSAAAVDIQRTFHLHVTDGPLEDPKQYTPVHARRLAWGELVEVLLDKQQPESPRLKQLAADIVRSLEREIGPRLATTLGRCQDIDGNGRFTILLTPWLERLQGGKTKLQGFARNSDFLERSPRPFSNRCDMIYLNATLSPGPHIRSLLAHELAHAICFSERKADVTGTRQFAAEEDWLNEAIAHLAENTCSGDWSNLDHRISAYLQNPSAFPLVVSDYYRAGLWRDPGCRGATYLFLRWCVDQYGSQLLRRLVRSRFNGRRSLEWATGMRFPELFRLWNVALAAECCAHTKISCPHPYRSIALQGQIGGCRLNGPAITCWEPEQGPLLQELCGTSFRIVHIDRSRSRPPATISVRGQPGTQLQVTLIRLPLTAVRDQAGQRIP